MKRVKILTEEQKEKARQRAKVHYEKNKLEYKEKREALREREREENPTIIKEVESKLFNALDLEHKSKIKKALRNIEFSDDILFFIENVHQEEVNKLSKLVSCPTMPLEYMNIVINAKNGNKKDIHTLQLHCLDVGIETILLSLQLVSEYGYYFNKIKPKYVNSKLG